jgi:heat shock protein HslJ
MKKEDRGNMKRILTAIMVILLVLSFCLAGCGRGPALENVNWILLSYGDPETPYAVLPDTEITVRFNQGTQKIRGNSGCNWYTGDYEMKGDNLAVKGPFAVTEMWCGDEVDTQEKSYLEILLAAESYEVGQDILEIFCGDDVLYFGREETE